MAASETAVANSALAKLGSARIVTLDDNTREARLIKEQFSKLRDELLRSHPWNFAIGRSSLAVLSSTPAFGFTYEFELPADCLRVLETDSNDLEWQIEGTVLRTDDNAVSIRYIKRVTETGKWDANFSELLALRIAYDIAYAVTQSASLKAQLSNEYIQKLREARSFDAQEGGTRQVYANQWLNSRN